MVARTVTDVVLGEATYGTKQQRFNDMLAIASVIANRSALHGVTPQQVVANQREFNAYGKALPKGVNAYRDLAERAIRQVQEQGPVHRGTFYATPSATKNLPKGLSQVARTSGHVYYSDPQRRPINTAVGTKRYQDKPAAMAYAPTPQKVGALAAIDSITSPTRAPTPTARPQVQGPNRLEQVAVARPTPRPEVQGPQRPASVTSASRIATPTARPTLTAAIPTRTFDPALSKQVGNFAPRSAIPATNSFAPRQVVAKPTQERQLVAPVSSRALATPASARIAGFSPRSPIAPSNVLSKPTASPVTTATPSTRTNFAGAAGSIRSLDARPTINPASPPSLAPSSIRAASSVPSQPALTNRPNLAAPVSASPARTNFAGAAGSPRSVDARLNAQLRSVNPMVSQASRPATVTPTARVNFAGPIGSPRAVEGRIRAVSLASSPVQGPVRPQVRTVARTQVQGPMRPASVVAAPAARIATPTARPTIEAPQTISSRPAARAVSVAVPQVSRSVPTPTPRDAWGGLRTGVAPAPSAPAAPATGFASRLGLTPGRIAGAAIGGLVGGPVGMIAGGLLGGRFGSGNSASSTSGFGGSFGGGGLSNQGSSLNGAGIGGGNRDRYGGFAGFSGDSSSTPGPDGGKVGGGSRSSSSSGGKSSGGGKGKK